MGHRAVIGGAGAYGGVYLHYLRASGVEVVGFLDDEVSKIGQDCEGVPVLGPMEMIPDLPGQGVTAFYAPIGFNRRRVELHDAARGSGLSTPNFVHPDAVVDSPLPPDGGVYVLPGSVVMPHSVLDRDVMISASANVAHHTRLGQGVFLSTGSSVGAGMTVGRHVYIGMGAILVTGKAKAIGADVVIGAGSVVLSDIADNLVVAGTPARPLTPRSHGAAPAPRADARIKSLAIIGAGRHARVVAECAEMAGCGRIGVYFNDSLPAETPQPWAVDGRCDDFLERPEAFEGVIVALGDNTTRLRVHNALAARSLSLATLIHPAARVSSRAVIGAGSVVLAGACVVIGARLGQAVIINTGATVDHDCELGDGVHISPGVNLAGGVRVGDRSWIGVGAVVRQGIVIGRDVVVGAGAIVVKDVPDGVTVVGNPARPLER